MRHDRQWHAAERTARRDLACVPAQIIQIGAPFRHAQMRGADVKVAARPLDRRGSFELHCIRARVVERLERSRPGKRRCAGLAQAARKANARIDVFAGERECDRVVRRRTGAVDRNRREVALRNAYSRCPERQADRARGIGSGVDREASRRDRGPRVDRACAKLSPLQAVAADSEFESVAAGLAGQRSVDMERSCHCFGDCNASVLGEHTAQLCDLWSVGCEGEFVAGGACRAADGKFRRCDGHIGRDVAHRFWRGIRARSAAHGESRQDAALCERDFASGIPRRLELSVRRDRAGEAARGKSAEARRVEARRLRSDVERALTVERRATAAGDFARAGAASEALDVDAAAGDRGGKLKRQIRLREFGAHGLFCLRDIRGEPAGESRGDQRGMHATEVQVAQGELHAARRSVNRHHRAAGHSRVTRKPRVDFVQRKDPAVPGETRCQSG